MERLSVLEEIDRLYDNNCVTCEYNESNLANKPCYNGCEIGKKLRACGDRIMQISRKKSTDILKKGQKMTLDEMRRLIERGVTIKEIAEHKGVSVYRLTKMLKENGLWKCKLPWTKNEEDYLIWAVERGHTNEEIAKKLNRTRRAVSERLRRLRINKKIVRGIRGGKKCYVQDVARN